MSRNVRGVVVTALTAVAFAAASAVTVPAKAGIVTSTQTENSTGVSFTGDFMLSNVTHTSATLTIILTNATPTAVGGALTAFAFNNPEDRVTDVMLTSTSREEFDTLLFDNNSINTPGQFGNFDIGLATNGGFQGGNVAEGIPANNQQGTFVFALTGDFDELDADSLQQLFVSAFSSEEQTPSIFAARFQGLAGGASDVAVDTTLAVGGPSPAPEPSTIALALTGLVPIGLAGLRRLHRRPVVA